MLHGRPLTAVSLDLAFGTCWGIVAAQPDGVKGASRKGKNKIEKEEEEDGYTGEAEGIHIMQKKMVT